LEDRAAAAGLDDDEDKDSMIDWLLIDRREIVEIWGTARRGRLYSVIES
jgi:hypothetical protein